MFSFSSFAFADYSDITIETTTGSSVPGCEQTSQSCYVPSIAKVDVGYTVIFSNTDNAEHTFTAGTPGNGPSGEFDSGLVKSGKSYQWPTTKVGDQPYFCVIHPWMIGLIIVEGVVELPSSISVFTDASSYHGKEHIKIYGKVTNPSGSTIVNLTIVSSNGILVDAAKTSRGDGFSRIVIPEDPLWKDGTYVVTAQYGPENISATTSFNFTGFVKTTFDENGFAIVLPDDEKYVNDEIFENNEIFENDVDEGQGNIGSDEKVESNSVNENCFTTVLPDYKIPNTGDSVQPSTGGYMGNVGSEGQTGSYTLEEALEIQKRRIAASEGNPMTECPPESVQNDYLRNGASEIYLDTDEWQTNNDLNLIKQNEKRIDSISKQLDSLSEKKIKSLDSKINREQSQYDEYLKQYDYYEGKTLSSKDEQKFQIIIEKLNSQNEKIDSLIDARNMAVLESDDVSEVFEEKKTPLQVVKQVEEKQEQISCFLFWCW